MDRSGKVRKRRLIARPRRRAAVQEESVVFQPHLKSFEEGVSGMVLCVPEDAPPYSWKLLLLLSPVPGGSAALLCSNSAARSRVIVLPCSRSAALNTPSLLLSSTPRHPPPLPRRLGCKYMSRVH